VFASSPLKKRKKVNTKQKNTCAQDGKHRSERLFSKHVYSKYEKTQKNTASPGMGRKASQGPGTPGEERGKQSKNNS